MGEHGGDIYSFENKDILDFSANINPFGVPDFIKDEIINSIDTISNYPDPYCRDLRGAIAKKYGIGVDNIVCGNGGADVILRLFMAIKPKKALIPVPTFSEYQESLSQLDCEINYYYMDESLKIKDDFIDKITDDIDLIVLCNPNNPTGALLEREFIVKVARASGKATILLDECFNDMLDNPSQYSLVKYIDEYKNVFILKSFTKMYAIAGLRLGYGISADKDLINKVMSMGQPWPVSTIASNVGIAAMGDDKIENKVRKFIKEERKYLCDKLFELGFEVTVPNANYVFFRAKGIFDLDKKLIELGILIRSCSNYVNLDGDYYRVAVRLREDNDRLIKAISMVI